MERRDVARGGRIARSDFGLAGVDGVFRSGGLEAGAHQFLSSCAVRSGAASGAALGLLARALGRVSGRALLIQAVQAGAEAGRLQPHGLLAIGLDPGRVAIVRVRRPAEALGVADEALKSRAAAAVLVEAGAEDAFDLRLTRRFNLTAGRAGALALLVGGGAGQTSAALTRWTVSPLSSRAPWRTAGRPGLGPPRFRLELVRSRLGPLGTWEVEWDADEHVFKPAGAALSAPSAALARGRARAGPDVDRRSGHRAPGPRWQVG